MGCMRITPRVSISRQASAARTVRARRGQGARHERGVGGWRRHVGRLRQSSALWAALYDWITHNHKDTDNRATAQVGDGTRIGDRGAVDDWAAVGDGATVGNRAA